MLTPISVARQGNGNYHQQNQAAAVINHFVEIILNKELLLSTATLLVSQCLLNHANSFRQQRLYHMSTE